MAILNSNQQPIIGWRSLVVTQVVNSVDADAQAFITAAGITNLTQASAINTLVNDLKTYGLWTKMKALYPMVGGTASSHKFNLKDARDLDAAYRLVFNGGWVHSNNGAKPNGTDAYADTKLNESTVLSDNNSHISVYSRTSLDSSTACDIGVTVGSVESNIFSKHGNIFYARIQANNGGVTIGAVASQAHYVSNRTDSTQVFAYRNAVKYTIASPSLGRMNDVFYLGAVKRNGTAQFFSSREQAFASIGDGLSDTEVTNFYNSIQKFQTTLGRNVGTPIVSDSDAQAFLNVAAITDLGQATAINTLVTDLKSAGVWTKMKALYPMIGGTATTHKFNLKDPRDLDEAFRLVFSGGWVHSATGAKPNGTTGYADTKFNLSTNLPNAVNSNHISLYVRENIDEVKVDMGIIGTGVFLDIESRISNIGYYGNLRANNAISFSNTDSRGLHINTRTTNRLQKVFINTILKGSDLNSTSGTLNGNISLAARYNLGNGLYEFRSSKEQAFASIGDGLTDTEATAFYTAVQKYQTSLGRHVGTPILADGLTAGLLETYTGAAVAYSLRKLRTGYIGNAIRVRRSSDNGEQDIPFNADGTLDTTALLSFVGSYNMAAYSEAFDNSYWHKNDCSIVANQTIAPNGTMTADLLREGTSLWNHSLGKYGPIVYSAGTSYNASVYIKKGTGSQAPNTFALGFSELNTTTLPYVIFNISTGVVVTSGNATNDSNFGYSIEDAGNGWFRCAMWGTVTTEMSRTQLIYVRFINNLNTLPSPSQYTGNVNRDMFVWGYQYCTGLNDTSVLTLKPYNGTTTSVAGNGYVTTWYDQSGNIRNATQTTAANQPMIVSNTVLNTVGGKPSVKFDGLADNILTSYNQGTSNEMYFVTQTTDTMFLYPSNGLSNYGFVAQSGSTVGISNNYGSPQLYTNGFLKSVSTRDGVYNVLNGYKLVVHKNVNISTWTSLIFGNYGSGAPGGYDYDGNLQEWIIYPTAQSSQSSIESTINSYYSIY